MARSQLRHIQIRNTTIPVKVFKERRRSIRISVGVEHLILRIPNYILSPSIDSSLKWAKDWFEKRIVKNPQLLNRFKDSSLLDGQRLKLFGRDYQLQIVEHLKDQTLCKISHDQIRVLRGKNHAKDNHAERNLIHRSLAKFFKAEMVAMVHHLNRLYFNEDLGRISLKYNRSNWGSCSTKKNINLSTRLLFAPISVMEYVIIHELAHLKEMNHSKRFWSIVETIDPKYREKEKWLKINAHKDALYFIAD